jgi:hypothetical protein
MEIGALKNTTARSIRMDLFQVPSGEYLEQLLEESGFALDREMEVIIVEKTDDTYGRINDAS